MPPRRTTRQRAAQQAQFKRNKPTKRHFLKNFITQQPQRKRLYAHSQPLNETNNGTVVRVIIGLLVLHVVVIGGVLMHDQLEKSGSAPEFEKKHEFSVTAPPPLTTEQPKASSDSKVAEGRKATQAAQTSEITAPVKPTPAPPNKEQVSESSDAQVREVTAVVAAPKNNARSNRTLPPSKTTPVAIIDARKTNKSSHQLREESRLGSYKTRSGDSFKSIASEFKISEQDLRKANSHITTNEQLYVGQSITIPRPSATQSPSENAQAYPDTSSSTSTDSQKSNDDLILEMDPYQIVVSTKTQTDMPTDLKPQPASEIKETVAVVEEPVDEPTAKTPDKPKVKSTDYTIRPGDTLSAIAKRHGMKLNDIKKLNGFNKKQADRIKPGQIIQLPPAAKPKVKRRR